MHATGYVVHHVDAPLIAEPVDTGALRPGDVLIRVAACGVCASDLDIIADAFGVTTFPLVPGHEVVGHVEAVGDDVVALRVGDRVGVGPLSDSCGHCDHCLAGREMYCRKLVLTARPGGVGGFATHLRVSERFAFPIPEAIDTIDAAPLLCAGLTTFSALRRFARPGMRVGVLGVGGLGHLAVQFARAMGCTVTTFSLAPDGAEAARHRRLGADRVVDVTDAAAVHAAGYSIDVLISTAYGDVDWNGLQRLIRPEGLTVILGGTQAPLNIPAVSMIHYARSVTGSSAGSRKDSVDMLRFAADHGVRAEVELLPIDRINEALDRVRAGQVRYRMVVDLAGADAGSTGQAL